MIVSLDANEMSAEISKEMHGNAPVEKLRPLFPNLPEAELSGLAETLNGYCAIAWRVYERLRRERPALIDELMRSRKMKGKVDSSK
jgi:hypothetical protein